MLQQTQVATVIPYYQKWLRVFPTLQALAKAPLAKVLRHWAGLGYYRRARKFHEAARYVVKNLGGHIPQSVHDLQKLPGIGQYTAGAIASIAFDERAPVLDGNVIRIFTRIFAIPQSIDQASTIHHLWEIAIFLLPGKNTGDFNQALMELGATLCFPLNPQCHSCPLKNLCAAHKKRKETLFPVRSRKEDYQKLHMYALILENRKKEVWLQKQAERDRWGGLWMFPFWENKNDMLRELNGMASDIKHCLSLRHAFTKYRIQLDVYRLALRKNLSPKMPSGRWVSLKKLEQTGLPSPHKKIAAYLTSGTRS